MSECCNLFFCRTITKFLWLYMIIVQPVQIRELINNVPLRKLPWNGFALYDMSSWRVYFLALACELLSVNNNIIVTLSHDSLVAGLLLQLCAQLDILKQQITNIPLRKDSSQFKIISKCVDHHNVIFR